MRHQMVSRLRHAKRVPRSLHRYASDSFHTRYILVSPVPVVISIQSGERELILNCRHTHNEAACMEEQQIQQKFHINNIFH